MVENERRPQGVGPPFFCVPNRQACGRLGAELTIHVRGHSL